MIRAKRVLDNIESGRYDRLFAQRYGEEKTAEQKERYRVALEFFGKTYGYDREIRLYSVPYSVILGSDGADIAIPTDIDRLALVAVNGTNVTRLRAKDFTGEDNMDMYQHGPYSDEYDRTMGVLRGMRQAFMRWDRKFTDGLDIYLDCPTLPGIGLDERAHLAATLAYIFNVQAFDGKITPKELGDMVQWTLINYALTDGYLTDTYSTLLGKVLTGEYSDLENADINEIEGLGMADCGLYTVNVGDKKLMAPEDMDPGRAAKFAKWLSKESIDEVTDKEFYAALAEKETEDIDAAVYYMDYMAINNFSDIYYDNFVQGDGSPSLDQSVEREKESTKGAAAKWYCKPYTYYGMVLCCVKDEAKEEFYKACEKLFGDGCVTPVKTAVFAAEKVIG